MILADRGTLPWTQACEWRIYFTESHALRRVTTAIMDLKFFSENLTEKCCFVLNAQILQISGSFPLNFIQKLNAKQQRNSLIQFQKFILTYPCSKLRISFEEFSNGLKAKISIDTISQPCSTLNSSFLIVLQVIKD